MPWQQQPGKTALLAPLALRLSNQPKAGSKAASCCVSFPGLEPPMLLLKKGMGGTVLSVSERRVGRILEFKIR